jgi:mRNA-degrading endonuclease RelE of RelBE toxin-antitoxin system
MPTDYEVRLTQDALADLNEIRDQVTLLHVRRQLKRLASHPRGKLLAGPLLGMYSVRAANSRIRIIFEADHSSRQVYVVAVGRRASRRHGDPYVLAAKRRKGNQVRLPGAVKT